MKITRIDTFKYWVDWCNWLFVRISTDEGLRRLGRGVAARRDRVRRDRDPRVRAAPGRAGPRRARTALAPPLSRVALARRRGVPDRAVRARHRAVGPRRQAPRRAGRPAAGRRRSARRLRGYASHWLQGARTPEEAFEGAREAARRGFTRVQVPAVHRTRACATNEARRDPPRRRADGSRARGRSVPTARSSSSAASSCRRARAVLLDDALRPMRPGWFEEPIPFENAKAMAQLQRDAAQRRSPPASACCRATSTASCSRTAAAGSSSPT